MRKTLSEHVSGAVCNVYLLLPGNSGQAIALRANFFSINSRPQWVLYQYHVDYQPPMESRRLRSALLYNHSELLGSARCFDGAVLFLPHKLPDKVRVQTKSAKPLQYLVKRGS